MQHQPHQFDAQTGEGLGVGNQVDGDSVVPESSKQKKSKGTSSVELLAPFLESPQEEPMFHLSNSNSTDDLHSVLKQVNQFMILFVYNNERDLSLCKYFVWAFIRSC